MDQTTPPEPASIEGYEVTPIAAVPRRWPGHYYGSVALPPRPLFPKWVPFGCGSAAIVALLILFVGGAIAGSGGAGLIFEMVFGSMQDEIDGMFSRQVPPAQKAEFDEAMKSLRARMKGPGVPLEKLQPLLRAIRDASSDGEVTAQEARGLTDAVRAVTVPPPARP